MKRFKRYIALITLVSVLFTTIGWASNARFVFAEDIESQSELENQSELPETEEATESDAADAQPGESTDAFQPQLRATAFTVNFYDWDGILITTQQVAAGNNATAPQNPQREGFAFTGWSAAYLNVNQNLDIYAQYSVLKIFTVVINYVFADGSLAAQPYIATVMEGYQLTETVISPVITGFLPDHADVAIDIPAAAQDEMYTVTYQPEMDTPYTVLHYLQDLDQTGYTIKATENLTGYTGESVTAAAKTYTGFTAPSSLPSAVVAADGSTRLEVYYTRDSYGVYFDTDGGSYIAPYLALYGQALAAPDPAAPPTKAGYTFAGWDNTMPAAMPAGDITLTALWTANSGVNYTVVYWLENANDHDYSYIGSVSKTGTAGGLVSYDYAPFTTGGISSVDGVTFPILEDYFTYDSYLTETVGGADTQTIKGDGTTIVEVYFTRNVYEIIFNNMHDGEDEYNIGISGSVYTGKEYSVLAKFDELIRFPIEDDFINLTSSKFFGWQDNSSPTKFVDYGKYLTVTKKHIDTMNTRGYLTAMYTTKGIDIWLYSYLEDFNGNYVESDTYSYKMASIGSGTWSGDPIEGYTWYSGHPDTATFMANDLKMYYTRNKYDLALINGNNRTDYLCSDGDGIFFEASLAGYVPTAPSHPSNVDADYSFAGWYTTQDCIDGTEFDSDTETMPSHNLVLYAKWVKPEYTVTFEPANGTPSWDESVAKGDAALQPADPINDGYTFAGWYKGSDFLRYIFESPVTENITLTARWILKSDIPYTVHYIIKNADNTETVHSTQIYNDGHFGDTITAEAISIPGYLPGRISQSITLNSSGNDINFYYVPFTSIDYTVQYLESGTGNVLAASEQKDTSNTYVTEGFKYIPGYTPKVLQQTLQLSSDVSLNVITFYYEKNLLVDYKVEHYIQNISEGYTLYSSSSSSDGSFPAMPVGSSVTASPISIDHFTYNAGISVSTGIVGEVSNSTVLRFYYDRDSYPYRVEYYNESISAANLQGIRYASGKYGKTVTATVLAADFGSGWVYEEIKAGYSVDSVSGMPFVISDNTASNVVYVIYTYIPVGAAAAIEGWKHLDGKNLENNMFHFMVKDANTDVVVASASNAADGKITFDSIAYDVAGIYEYKVLEEPGNLSGITYDTKEYRVKVTVTDDNAGTLTAKLDYVDGPILFENAYTVSSTEVTLTGKKTLAGRALTDNMFSFEVKDLVGNPLAVGTNKADGNITFSPITYSIPGSYEYVISEAEGTLAGIVYDTAEYRVKVEVVDNGDGTMTATPVYVDGDVEFTNHCVGGVRLTKYDMLKTIKLPNAVFELYTEAGILVGTYITDSIGVIKVDGLVYGNYYFKEKTAPSGYRLNTGKVSFVLNDETTNSGTAYAEVAALNDRISESEGDGSGDGSSSGGIGKGNTAASKNSNTSSAESTVAGSGRTVPNTGDSNEAVLVLIFAFSCILVFIQAILYFKRKKEQ